MCRATVDQREDATGRPWWGTGQQAGGIIV